MLSYCDDDPLPPVWANSVPCQAGGVTGGGRNRAFRRPRGSGKVRPGFPVTGLPPAAGRPLPQGLRRVPGFSAVPVARQYRAEFGHLQRRPNIPAGPKPPCVMVAARRAQPHPLRLHRDLRAGKAVFVEKPLATRLEDLEEIRTMYEELQSASARGTDRRPLLAVGYDRATFRRWPRLLKQALAQTSEPLAAPCTG